MAIVFGACPGGKNAFAITALFWNRHPPASLIFVRSQSSVEAAVNDIVGTVGEWGELSAVAIAAPLSWSTQVGGFRKCDLALRKRLPSWAPKTWHRPPNALPGAVSIQGPALAWTLANEIKNGQLPQHPLVETNPRVSLALTLPNEREALLGYAARGGSAEAKAKHVGTVLTRLCDAGLIRIDADTPKTPEELDATVASLVALALGAPEAGLVVHELAGGEVRPVGKRPVVVLEALP